MKSKSALTLEMRSDSLKRTAGLHRTDIPLVDMFTNAQPVERTCCSLPTALPGANARLDSIELQKRRQGSLDAL